MSVGSKLQRDERSPDSLNDVRHRSSVNQEVAAMPWLQNLRGFFFLAVSLPMLMPQQILDLPPIFEDRLF